MNKNISPEELAWQLTKRVQLVGRKKRYQMAAVIVDHRGRFVSWGWAHTGSQGSVHAEIHALKRANPARLGKTTLVGGRSLMLVAGRRLGSERPLLSRPCLTCWKTIRKAGIRCILYLTPSGWCKEEIE